MGTAVRKVRGGKLLRVALEHDDSVITELTITGDFFLYPEEGLEMLEQGLRGSPMSGDLNDTIARIDAVLISSAVTPLGFSSRDLAEAIMEAKR